MCVSAILIADGTSTLPPEFKVAIKENYDHMKNTQLWSSLELCG